MIGQLTALLLIIWVTGSLKADQVDELVHQLESSDVKVRSAAAEQLVKLSPDVTKSAVPALSKALKDKDESVRIYASHALRDCPISRLKPPVDTETRHLCFSAPSD
jgi:HEAT repeat protein